MVNFTLKDVALKELIIALKFFTLLILGLFFIFFFQSIKCSGLIQGIMGFLALCTFAMVIAILFPSLRDKEDEGAEGYFFAVLVILTLFVAIKSYFAIFFYDEFMRRVSDILPYLSGYALIYFLVVSVHLFSKKIKVGYPEGLVDEYKRALEQKDEDTKFFVSDSGDLPDISDMNKNLNKSIRVGK